ncbi:MAG: HD superfamily phosphohydrolase [Candidatus Nanohaloarchaea archaeon]|jgi:HD superfamily phosphohydrolase
MEVDDTVYRENTIEKTVIKELIQTEPVQRLKDIQQAGPQKYFIDKEPVTRYEHSIGVFLLLKKFDASLEEQIAGLLHDVPHTAFSHLVDFVFQTEKHDYHDDFLDEIVYDSEIPEILERHGIDVEEVLDESNFKLLERDMPSLCADRIDYFLRDLNIHKEKDVQHFVDALTVHDNEFMLSDKEIAEEYALEFIGMDRDAWASPKEVAVNELFAKVIRRAFEIDLLTEEELFENDEYVYSKIAESDDEEINEVLDTLKSDFDVKLSDEDPDVESVTKARFVDPHVVSEGEVMRVTDYSEELKQEIEEHKDKVRSGYSIKLV